MTRTTLLQLLAHPAALTGADVRELEQLAQAFPYCQTAHLLLAKAAHDQGSMLASQRLRRAATYTPDRTRLRQLMELAPTPVAEPTEPEPAAMAEPAPMAVAAEQVAPTSPVVAVAELLPTLPAEPEPAPPAEPELTEPLITLAEEEPPVVPLPEATSLEPAATDVVEEPAVEVETAEIAEETEAEAVVEDELPAQAPPIRPPAEAELAHAEFGLADAEPTEIIAYRLPEVELPLGITIDVLSSPLPAFRGDPEVGYAPSEGSRLGFSLQGLAPEYSLMTGPAALLPSATLPPTSEFFAPDALVLAHLTAHQTLVPALGANDLIDSFLRRSPQGAARRRAQFPPATEEEQPDLSSPSTRSVPDLASENLAQILVRQGKPERAIAIYERLIVKHPEKMAYFTAQIDSLRPSA
jgi:hypothetical protein